MSADREPSATTRDAAVVLDFIRAWNEREPERVAAALAEDALYHNIPMAPVRGRGEIMARLAPLIRACSEIDWRVHKVADDGQGTVLTERTDDFVRDGKRISVRVMGAFELRNGRIAEWRDYFDLQEYESQL